MAQFQFIAQDSEGQIRQGTTDAPTINEVTQLLRGRGWLILQIKPTLESSKKNKSWLPKNWLPIRSSDIEIALQQLSVMLKSGMPLLMGIEVLKRQALRTKMAQVWRLTEQDIENGESLAGAMSKHRCFPQLVLKLVEVGENTGKLEEVLKKSAEMLENKRSLRNQLLTALAYPSIVLIAAIGVTVFMLVSVIPKIELFLGSLGRRLPPLTQLLVDISSGVRNYALLVFLGIFFVGVSLFAFYRWPPGRFWIDRFALKIPILGRILKLSATILFARTMSMMLESGLTLLESLQMISQLHSNQYLIQKLMFAGDYVLQGGSLSEPIAQSDCYMPMLGSMVAVGETAGNLVETLREVAHFHETQLKLTIRWLGTLIEPLIIVVVGGIVGFVYVAFFVAVMGGVAGR